MKKIIGSVILIMIVQIGWAQKFSVVGQVADSLTGPLPSATVVLQNMDSSLVNFGSTDLEGKFEIKNFNKGQYRVNISYIGYRPFNKTITTPESGQIINLGKIVMKEEGAQMEELIILGQRIPVTIKGDTIEFNASSFQLPPNASVEDLLKQLPGVEISADGTVTAQGETVQQVLVNGREFFGKDPKMATRGLPADAVEKVQVFDKKSDQAVFSGIDDGQRQKTINLEIKKDRLKGYLGNITAGTNGEDRHIGKLSVNRFSDTKLTSIQGFGNNVNENGFGNFGGGGNSGIATSYGGAMNLSRDLGKKIKLSSSYQYTGFQRETTTVTQRASFVGEDSTLNNYSDNFNDNTSDTHTVNMRIEQQLDSANSLIYSGTGTYGETQARTTTNESADINGDETSSLERIKNSGSINKSLNASILWRHRFSKPGRTFSSNFNFRTQNSDTDGTTNSTGTGTGQTFTQLDDQSNNSMNYSVTMNYSEPLGANKYLEATYNLRATTSDVDNKVFRDESVTPDPDLTVTYSSLYLYNQPGLSVRFVRTKSNISIGASYQNTQLKGDLTSIGQTLNRTYNNVLPFVRYNYDFSNAKRLRINYQTDMGEPSVTQLQPVKQDPGSLNVTIGNPDLKPSYTHTVSANYNSFDAGRFVTFLANGSANYTANPIVNASSYDFETGQKISQPVNVDHNMSLNGRVTFGFQVNKLNSRFNFGPNVRYSKTPTVIEGDQIDATNINLGSTITYGYTLANILTVDLSANLSRSETDYESGSSNQNQLAINQNFRAESNLTIHKKYQIHPSFVYQVSDNKTTGFSNATPTFNMYVSRLLFKNSAGELRFSGNNILDYSQNITQNISDNYIETVQRNNLGRYFLVSFTYALNRGAGSTGGGGVRVGVPGGPR